MFENIDLSIVLCAGIYGFAFIGLLFWLKTQCHDKKEEKCKKCGAVLLTLPEGSGYVGGCGCQLGNPPRKERLGFDDEELFLINMEDIIVKTHLTEDDLVILARIGGKLRHRGVDPIKVLDFEFDRRFNN